MTGSRQSEITVAQNPQITVIYLGDESGRVAVVQQETLLAEFPLENIGQEALLSIDQLGEESEFIGIKVYIPELLQLSLKRT